MDYEAITFLILNSKTSKLYSRGVENWGTKSTSVTIKGHSADQAFVVALAGSTTARLFSFIYGIDESDNVLCENLAQGKESITILGSYSNREITINIGDWGRGVIYSYLPFALTVS